MREEGIAALRSEAENVRTSGVLGRSLSLNRLFDFLLERSAAGTAPKEIEVAQEVFGKSADLDLGQDASVRVNVHRLRRKLEERYRDAGDGAPRLVIPRGEYRLALVHGEEAVPEPPVAEHPPAPPKARRWPIVAAALVAVLLVNLAGWYFFSRSRAGSDAGAAARTALWAPLAAGDRPTLLVVGDYYIFGEAQGGTEVTRLVRQFSINSRDDLDQYLMEHPNDMGRLVDLDLHYLPVGAASALNAVLPVVDAAIGGKSRVRVITASQLTPDLIKRSNVVYVGYLSGLGLLRDPVFDASGFSVGASYDELVDDRSGRHFTSDWADVASGNLPHRDYGYLASFTVPGGSRIIVVAGTRDAALAQTAEMAVDPPQLKTLQGKAGDLARVEALYEVGALGNTNLAGRLVLARTIGGIRPGSQRRDRAFPDQLPDRH